MTINVYKSSDASAPTLNGTAGSLISVLDACLVNGYGSKAAAGWTKEYSGTNLAAYRMSTVSPATGMYLRVDDTGTTNARLVGYETMSDIDTGTSPFPTSAQVSGGQYWWKSTDSSSTARPWAIIASERSFYLYSSASLTGTVLSSDSSSNLLLLFGDIISRKAVDGYECAIIGAMSNGYNSNQSGRFGEVQISFTNFSVTSNSYLARQYTGLGGSTAVGKGRVYRHNSSIGNTMGSFFTYGFPNSISQNFDFCKISINEGSTIVRGFLPGLYEPLSGISLSPWFEYTGQGNMSGKNLLFVPVNNGSSAGMVAIQTNGSWY